MQLERGTMKKHHTTTLIIDGCTADIDTEIAPLVETMNAIKGLTTDNCCQGDCTSGYVSFHNDSNADNASVTFLQLMIQFMDRDCRNRSLLEAQHVATHGLRNGDKALTLYFEIEMGNSYVMRWLPDTYPFALKAARRAAKTMHN